MKRNAMIALFILGALAFGMTSTIAREQAEWVWRLLLGAVSGVVAGFATLPIAWVIRPSAPRVRMPDDDPRLRWWFYVQGMILAADFGALLTVQDKISNEGARSIVLISAGVIEAFAFMSLVKAVSAGIEAKRSADRKADAASYSSRR